MAFNFFTVRKVDLVDGALLTLFFNGRPLSDKKKYWLPDSPSNRVKLWRLGKHLTKIYLELRSFGLTR